MRNSRLLRPVVVTGLAVVLFGASACSSDDGTAAGVGATTTADADDTTGSGDPEIADPEVDEIPWDRPASAYSGTDGPVSVTCSPDDSPGPVWGTGPFTADSSVCTAAVFAGKIAPQYGGEATFQFAEGLESYDGGEANGVTTQAHGASESSFDFIG